MTNPGISSLSAYWSLDEFSGTRYDKSVVGLDLTAMFGLTSKHGKRGRCCNFIAADSKYLYITNNTWLDMSGNVSFELGCWIKPSSISSTGRIMNRWRSGGKEYILYMASGGDVYFIVYDGSSNYIVQATSFGSLSVDVWYFVYGYFNASTNVVGVGVNDVWNTAAGPTGGVVNYPANDFCIGVDSDKSTEFFDGLVDEAFVYKSRVLAATERTWLYNSGHGRTYEDVAEIKPPVVSIETGLTIGNLPIHVFDNTLKRIDMIEDYYSLSWAERYNEIGDFELDVPMSWEASPSIDFGNFLYIKSSNTLMIIEDKTVAVVEDKTSIVITGRSAETLLTRRIIQDPFNVDSRSEIIIYYLILDNITLPAEPKREFTLFDPEFPEMLLTAEHKDYFDRQTVYDAIVTIAKAGNLGFKVVCGDFEVGAPKLTFYVYEGVDRSYAQGANAWVIFSEKFNNILTSSFYSSEKDLVTVNYVLTDDVVPFTELWGWLEDPEPEDLDRIEKILEIDLARDSTDPPMSGSAFIEIIDTRQMQFIKESGPLGLLEGDLDIQFNHIYGEEFFMGDIVQCDIHGLTVGARVIELVRSYSAEGEKAYLGLDFIMV